ncbi:hypothetical protein DSM112329_02984 [Paraconexibacter sp. AEG42_29]|uniref:Probable membrane transporter protein n=1 Tax=Paraconexibacter sp. AEG42_29 TaxID=2997339 RepID=A0AAU7AWP7_9ACTN
MIIEAVTLGLLIGVVIGMLGGGGAILTVPVLVYALGQDVHTATTTSLLVVALASGVGAWGQARHECVCWKHTSAFAPTALAGTVAGTALNQLVGATALLLLFAGLMLAAALATWNNGAAATEGVIGTQCPPVQRTRVILAGLGVGFLTGFLGVGGGFVIVPVLAVLLAMPMRGAIGTSLSIVTIVSACGLAAHLVSGSTIDFGIAVPLAAGCIAGAVAGPQFGRRVSAQHLAHGFAALLILVAGYVLIATAISGGAPGA